MPPVYASGPGWPAIASALRVHSDPLARWRETVSRDPWIEECANILGDMAK